jgi:hypothetical protein
MAKTNVFPLFLDADAVAVTADDATFEVTSSRVTLNGTASCDIVLDDAKEVGTVVRFEAVTSVSNNPTVQATTGFSETITFNTVGDTATCMYFDGGWRVIANDGCSIA